MNTTRAEVFETRRISGRQRNALILAWSNLGDMAIVCAASGQSNKARRLASAMRALRREFQNNPSFGVATRERLRRVTERAKERLGDYTPPRAD